MSIVYTTDNGVVTATVTGSEIYTSTITTEVFNGNSNVTKVIINGYTTINKLSFANRQTLTHFSVSSVTLIDEEAFINCTGLTFVSLPSVNRIAANAFSGCINLVNVTRMDNVQTINRYAFYNTKITSISLPNISVLSTTAFAVSNHLNQVYLKSPNPLNVTVPSTAPVTFYGKSGVNLLLITVPAAPTNVTCVAGNSSASVYWTPPSNNGGSTITSYTVTPYDGSTAGISITGITDTTYTVTGLTNAYAYTFQVQAVNAAGTGSAGTSTSVNPICFNEGTKILCLNNQLEEEYVPIENLRKGDLVKSFKHGYRKIDLIRNSYLFNNPNIWNQCMYKMVKTEENGLLEDLIVTGGHSILVDDLGEHAEENNELFSGEGGTPIIDGKYLLLASVSKDFQKMLDDEIYVYYHFILENNGDLEERFGVWGNGVLTETPSKKNFINSHLFT